MKPSPKQAGENNIHIQVATLLGALGVEGFLDVKLRVEKLLEKNKKHF